MPRKVDCSGKIGLYNDKLYVGSFIKGKEVMVHFDAGRPSGYERPTRGKLIPAAQPDRV